MVFAVGCYCTLVAAVSVWCCMAEADEVIRAEDWSVRGHYCRQCGAFYPTPEALVEASSSSSSAAEEAPVRGLYGPLLRKAQGE